MAGRGRGRNRDETGRDKGGDRGGEVLESWPEGYTESQWDSGAKLERGSVDY